MQTIKWRQWIQQGPALQHRELESTSCNKPEWKRTWKRMRMCVYICVYILLFSHSVMSSSVIPCTLAHQASLFFTISCTLLKFMSIESVMPFNQHILCCPLLLLPSIFPSIRVFSNESILHIRWQSIGVLASASVLPVNIQGWFSLGLTGLIPWLSKGL